jgi:hypothetical protein
MRILILILVALTAVAVDAQPADVTAIQRREASNADARTLVMLERFRKALVDRYGGDPRLTMLAIRESEGQALVLRAGDAPEHVIWQNGRWAGTENRQLRPWASASLAATNAFALSSVRAAPFRTWQDAWRAVPAQATDFVTHYEVGFDPAAGRVVVRAQVGSMTKLTLSVHAFDASTGASLAETSAKR